MRGAYVRMHLAILLWGFTAILGKLISLDAGLLVWYRMLFSFLAMGIFLFFQKRDRKIPVQLLWKMTGIGGLIALHWVTFYLAIKVSNVSVAISCFSSVALFSALLEPLIHRKLPKTRELFFAIMVAVGIGIIFSVQYLYLKGILIALLSAFLAALFTVLNKSVSEKIPAGEMTFCELASGWAGLTLILPLWFTINHSGFAIPSSTDLLYLLLLSIVCTTFAFTISLQALRKLDAFTLNFSVNLEPVYSMVLAAIFFGENKQMGIGFYLGALILLATVVWYSYLRFTEKKPVLNTEN